MATVNGVVKVMGQDGLLLVEARPWDPVHGSQRGESGTVVVGRWESIPLGHIQVMGGGAVESMERAGSRSTYGVPQLGLQDPAPAKPLPPALLELVQFAVRPRQQLVVRARVESPEIASCDRLGAGVSAVVVGLEAAVQLVQGNVRAPECGSGGERRRRRWRRRETCGLVGGGLPGERGGEEGGED